MRVASVMQSPFTRAVRLYWGWQFMQTGWGKLSDIGKVISFFTDLGIPAPALNAWFVSALEFGGGALLILGLGSPRVYAMELQPLVFPRTRSSSFPRIRGTRPAPRPSATKFAGVTGPNRSPTGSAAPRI